MANIFDTQLTYVDEVTYGTAIAATRGLEILDESIKGNYARIDSAGLRSANRVLRNDRFVINTKDATGDVDFEVEDTQFGLLFKHMLGTVATGSTALGVTTHTFTVGTLNGKSFTTQVNRPDSGGNDNVCTYEGGKVTAWELSNSVDGVLKLKTSLDFEAETIGAGAGAYAKQTVAYPATTRLLTFVGGVITLDAAAVNITDVSIKGNNNLKTDRFFFTSTKTKKEPLESGMREYSFDLTAEFDSLAIANKVKSATRAGALGALSLVWTGPETVAGGGQPSLTVTIPQARFDDWNANIGGAGLLDQSATGKILWDGTTSPITMVYVTADTTP